MQTEQGGGARMHGQCREVKELGAGLEGYRSVEITKNSGRRCVRDSMNPEPESPRITKK